MFILCGPIASGKSTYCQVVAKRGMIIINDDDIINSLHANNYVLYDKNLKIIYKSIENSIANLCFCAKRTVVVDRGLNVSKKGRQRWIAMSKSFDVPCEAIVFPKDTPDVHAMRRFKSNTRGHSIGYWLHVANEHNKIYETPSLDEGFDKIHNITFEEITKGRFIE